MEQVDALKRARLDWPDGLPFIRPSVRAPVLVATDAGIDFKVARFGMSKRFSSFNARDDKLTQSGLWKGMFGKSHAVVALSYVVEWVEKKGERTPYLIGRKDGGLLMAPALFGPHLDHKEERGFALCTRQPNRFFAHFHGRMVGVLTPSLMDRWMAPAGRTVEELMACVRAPDEDELVARRASSDIGKRKSGDWSAIKTEGEPLTFADLAQGPP
jgi:putative SOS response-associated peptidase YedK